MKPYQLRRILPLALLVMFCISTIAAPAPPFDIRDVLKGFGYMSVEGKVKIKFPAAYQVDVSPGDSHTTTKVSAAQGDLNFFLSYTIHETEMTAHYDMAELSLNAFSEKLGARNISQSDYQYKSHRGRMAEMMLDEQGIRIYYRALLVGQIQYQLIVTMPGDQEDQGSVAAFFKSFKLMK